MPVNNMVSLEFITKQLLKADRTAILPHVEADGDAVGSSLALCLAMKKCGKEAFVLLEEKISGNYDFLPHGEETFVYGDKTGFSLVVALDTGDMPRLGKRAGVLKEAALSINIDHHATNTGFAIYNHVDIKKSATGEIIYEIIKKMGCKADKDIAECLYTAISTDTGSFRYANTNTSTHIMAAELLETGIDQAEISRKVFDIVSYSKAKLAGLAASSLELVDCGKIALITLTAGMLAETGAREEDCEGLVNIGRNVEGVEVAVMIREKIGPEPMNIKVNFRSNTDADVSRIASAFGGGGHAKAAGCVFSGTMAGARDDVINEIRKEIERVTG